MAYKKYSYRYSLFVWERQSQMDIIHIAVHTTVDRNWSQYIWRTAIHRPVLRQCRNNLRSNKQIDRCCRDSVIDETNSNTIKWVFKLFKKAQYRQRSIITIDPCEWISINRLTSNTYYKSEDGSTEHENNNKQIYLYNSSSRIIDCTEKLHTVKIDYCALVHVCRSYSCTDIYFSPILTISIHD